MRTQALKGHLDMLLLAVLNERPCHGYAIIEALRDRSGEVFDLPDGTVYPALHRLEEAGLVSSEWSHFQGRRRRTYAITKRGRSSLDDQRATWQQFTMAVDGVLGDGTWPATA